MNSSVDQSSIVSNPICDETYEDCFVSNPICDESLVYRMKEITSGTDTFRKRSLFTPPSKSLSYNLEAQLDKPLLSMPETPIKQNKKSMFDEAPINPVLNPALKQIGLPVLEQYFRTIYDVSSDPIVSIGSGNGYIERHMEKLFGKSIYCVDPNRIINSNSELYKTSEHENVYKLLEANSSVHEHSTMFINWSTPNESTYDFEAIKAIIPNNLLIVFESTGSGGGRLLQKWLNFCGIVTDEEPTQSEIAIYSFPKYNVVCSTVSRVEHQSFGQFEYEIVWLSKTPIEIDTSLIPKYIGTHIPRRSYNPLDTLLDSLMTNVGELSKQVGMGDYWNNITRDINESRDRKETQKEEKSKYGGFLAPITDIEESSLETMKDLLQEMKVGEVIECHHPYYRNLLRMHGKLSSITLVSHVDDSLKKDDDSMLLYHNACKKCTPVAKVSWYPDYSSSINPGEIYQMQANCEHCSDGKILSDYKDRKDSRFGYRYMRGKNCLKLVSKV